MRPARKAYGPERYPFDSAEPSTLLKPKHPEFGCFADWFLWDVECFKCSDWITVTIGAWSGRRWFESDKDQMQTIHLESCMFLPFDFCSYLQDMKYCKLYISLNKYVVVVVVVVLEENWKYRMAVWTIAKVIRTFDGVEGISAEQKEGIVNYVQRKDILAVLPTGYGKSLVITAVPVTTWYMQSVKEGR